jgi:hypothetical protein
MRERLVQVRRFYFGERVQLSDWYRLVMAVRQLAF